MGGQYIGEFMGKLVFASAGTGNPACLSLLKTRLGPDEYQCFPAMLPGDAGATGYCTIYGQADGTVRIQMSNQQWIALDPVLGNLTLTSDFAGAIALTLGGSPWGQTWQVMTATGWQPVVYYPDTTRPVLTINAAAGDQQSFGPQVITPSVATLKESKRGSGVDLSGVILDGTSLGGIDFSAANFSGASLRGTDLSRCLLTGANLTGAQMNGVSFDQATLDNANLTQATLATPGWGAPASARGIILDGCRAAGMVLGGQGTPLDCSGALIRGAALDQADLSGLILTGASLANSTLVASQVANAVLDKADLTGVLAIDASFKGASLKNARGQGANFVRADFSAADLGQAQLGAKQFLFALPASYRADLQQNYPDTALLAAFSQQGVPLSPRSPIEVLSTGERWQIDDPSARYLLILNDLGISVFLVASSLSPAVMYQALCLGTKASGASLAGVDLRGARWYGSGATLDHADLEGANLSGALLASLDLTQAFLSGADLSNSVLVQARLAGCVINSGASGQAFSLEGAQVQGCDFSNANLLSGLLVNAGVALEQGVPLFALPMSAASQLTPAGVASLAPEFLAAGYPLGSSPSVNAFQVWEIDNSSDPDDADAASYVVRQQQGQLNVYDGDTGAFEFVLPLSVLPLLAATTPSPQLISLFSNAGLGLAASASIDNSSYWLIEPSSDAGLAGAFGYNSFRVVQQGPGLQVFGTGCLLMRDWMHESSELAFGSTNGLQAALSRSSLGPAGYPASCLQGSGMSWQAFVTAAR
ncbi:pentapeptide repeat-containing protein [Pseudomonas wadenswilerensis]